MSASNTKEDIKEYYAQCHSALGEGWLKNDHRGVHVGYFDDEHTDHDSAIENMTRVTADAVDIDADDRVLNAGCGVGGPATWIAANRDAEVVGINISDTQLDLARELAEERGVSDQTTFKNEDFTEMSSLADNSFDVVWGLEAICYAQDKTEFLDQAERVLKDDGRLVVVDGFMTERDLDPVEEEAMEKWLDGWAMSNLAHIEDFTAYLDDLGFDAVESTDIRENVVKSSKKMYYYGIVGYPFAKLLQLVGLRSETQVKNVLGCYYQYKGFERGVWNYFVVTAER